MQRVQRHLTRHAHESGMSPAYVLIAALVLVAGTATLMSRTSSALLGSLFQGQSWQARDTARIGMAYLISQINRERNRHLLAVLDSQMDANPNADRTIWTDSSASSNHKNPCLVIRDSSGTRIDWPEPSLADLNIGSVSTNQGYLYINNDGSISKTRGTASRAFRLITTNPNQNFRLARKSNLFLLDDIKTKGSFRLSVEGVVYRGSSNEIMSRTILQEDFDVIPKCCKVPFGGFEDSDSIQRGHGNNNYQVDRLNLSSNACILDGLNPDGFGVVVGASGTGGTIDATGGPTIQNPLGQIINPVYCISSDPTKCTPADNDSNNIMERIDVELPPPPMYPGSWLGTPPILTPCKNESNCPSNKNTTRGSAADAELTYYDTSSRETVLNAPGVLASNLPSNCTIHRDDLHCIYEKANLSSSLTIVTGNTSRRMRLYFPISPSDGYIIKRTGGNQLRHCKTPTCDPAPPVDNITDLSVFGCSIERGDPGCGKQTIDIQGSAGAAGFYIFAPHSDVLLTGTGEFRGVLWVNSVSMTGTTAVPIVPTSGVADVFILLGILPGESNTYDQSLTGEPATTDLFAWDMVARSAKRFRFLGN